MLDINILDSNIKLNELCYFIFLFKINSTIFLHLRDKEMLPSCKDFYNYCYFYKISNENESRNSSIDNA